MDTLALSRRCAVGRVEKVAGGVGGTATFDAVNYMPVVGVANPVSCGLICYRQLTRAAAVNRGVLAVGTKIELEFEA